jgi:hypothetical protein
MDHREGIRATKTRRSRAALGGPVGATKEPQHWSSEEQCGALCSCGGRQWGGRRRLHLASGLPRSTLMRDAISHLPYLAVQAMPSAASLPLTPAPPAGLLGPRKHPLLHFAEAASGPAPGIDRSIAWARTDGHIGTMTATWGTSSAAVGISGGARRIHGSRVPTLRNECGQWL